MYFNFFFFVYSFILAGFLSCSHKKTPQRIEIFFCIHKKKKKTTFVLKLQFVEYLLAPFFDCHHTPFVFELNFFFFISVLKTEAFLIYPKIYEVFLFCETNLFSSNIKTFVTAEMLLNITGNVVQFNWVLCIQYIECMFW